MLLYLEAPLKVCWAPSNGSLPPIENYWYKVNQLEVIYITWCHCTYCELEDYISNLITYYGISGNKGQFLVC